MKVLFIGGTGLISSACTQLAVDRGINVYHLNRGQSTRMAPVTVKNLRADIRDKDSVFQLLRDMAFDVVVDWIAFTPEHVEVDLELFRGRTKQYIFISSASIYQTPPTNLPITESTPLRNPYWAYSRAKIACEVRLMQAYRQDEFPITIVRPSHTYDCTFMPMRGRYTVVDRIRKGKKVIVHGDGTSLWTLTHNSDFAKGFVGLLGNSHAIGEAFHITSDEVLTWNNIFVIFAQAAGTKAKIVHIPSDLIATYNQEWGDSLLGDKAHSRIFDNTKIKRIVPDFTVTTPFMHGAEEIIAWFSADLSRQIVDKKMDRLMDKIIAAQESAYTQVQYGG
ncbi:SDR family oxidoreductase [Chloroflexota bacterium]